MHVIDDFTYYVVVDNAEEIVNVENYDYEYESRWLDDLGWI